jgi:hypothetical protein
MIKAVGRLNASDSCCGATTTREFFRARLERIATRSLLPSTAKDSRLPALTLEI